MIDEEKCERFFFGHQITNDNQSSRCDVNLRDSPTAFGSKCVIIVMNTEHIRLLAIEVGNVM